MTSEARRQSDNVVPYGSGMPLPAQKPGTGPVGSAIDAAYQALVLVIQRAQAAVRRHHPEVPETFTMVAPDVRGRALAYFGPKRWKVGERTIGEIGLAADYLELGGTHTMESLLHESVHAACAALGVRDTSREGRYHNRRFAERAHGYGLIVERDKVVGHTTTGLTAEAASTYALEIAALDWVLGALYRLKAAKIPPNASGGIGGGDARRSSYVSAICGCGPIRGRPRRLRMARREWDRGGVRCSICGCPFEEDGLDESRQDLRDIAGSEECTHHPLIEH